MMKITINYLNVVAGTPEQVQALVEQDDFRDAIYYPTIAAQQEASGDGSLVAEATKRVNNYLAAVAPKEPEVTVLPDEQAKLNYISSLRNTVADVLTKLDTLKDQQAATVAVEVAVLLKG